MGAFGVNIARPTLQRTLFAALPPGTVECGLAFASAERLPDGRMQVRLAPAGEGEERVEVCDVLVGADGLWSAVRGWIDGQPDAPSAPRQPSYRG